MVKLCCAAFPKAAFFKWLSVQRLETQENVELE